MGIIIFRRNYISLEFLMLFRRKLNPIKIKNRNTKLLKKQGIIVVNHLPYLDLPKFRNPQVIARRTLILSALFQLYLEAPNDVVQSWLEENNLIQFLTKKEKYILKTNFEDLQEQDKIDVYWYLESIWAFAWAGGLHNNLTFNSEAEETLASLIPNIQLNEKTDDFILNFELRDNNEIFETLDKFYRAHWFARRTSFKKGENNIVDLDIIIERRKALEYICYHEYTWDDIPMGT